MNDDPVVLLERLAVAVVERGPSTLDVWRFIGALIRIEELRPEFIDALAPPVRQLFHDAKDTALREFDGHLTRGRASAVFHPNRAE